MLKVICVICLTAVLFSCNQNKDESAKILTETYKPGLGEFMTGIQIHHAKLWFAGNAENWKLADFELNEINETLDAIKIFQKERSESQALNILNPAIDSVRISIQQQSLKLFIKTFTTLTNTCNDCHEAVKFEFNKVKIPDSPPFSNQDFSTGQK